MTETSDNAHQSWPRRHPIWTAVMVAPFLGIGFFPAVLNRPLAQIADEIPNIWMWWDPTTKADNPFSQDYQSHP